MSPELIDTQSKEKKLIIKISDTITWIRKRKILAKQVITLALIILVGCWVSFRFPNIPHEPITFSSNSDGDWVQFPGEGTAEDPYVISGLSFLKGGITVRDTSVHFVIRGCYFARGTNLHLTGVYNGVVEDCEFEGYINVVDCWGIVIQSSNFHYERYRPAIGVFSSRAVAVIDNTITSQDGLLFDEECDLFLISNNSIRLCDGIRIRDCSNGMISGNEVFDCYDGVFIEQSSYLTLLDNVVWNADGAGLTVERCSTISIQNEDIQNSGMAGIAVEYSNGVEIKEAVVLNNWESGIALVSCKDAIISESVIQNNGIFGIAIQKLIYEDESDSILVFNCTISNNDQSGIFVSSTGHCSIEQNEISDNALSGISFQYSPWGTVASNHIHHNGEYGLYIYACSPSISNNTYEENGSGDIGYG